MLASATVNIMHTCGTVSLLTIWAPLQVLKVGELHTSGGSRRNSMSDVQSLLI